MISLLKGWGRPYPSGKFFVTVQKWLDGAATLAPLQKSQISGTRHKFPQLSCSCNGVDFGSGNMTRV
jgi:hypothetical protein